MWLPRLQTECCALCHEPDAADGLCAGCLNDLSALYTDRRQNCPTCAAFSAGGQPCPECRIAPPPLQAVWATLDYRPPLPALIHHWKHLRHIHLSTAIWTLMRGNPPPWLPESDIDGVLAMPVSRKRRLLRGFNQSGELAQALAAAYRLPLLSHHSVLRRHKAPQSTLNREQRLLNIRGSFRIAAPIKARHILLIDDIMTTGSSLFELAYTLHDAGIRTSAWLLARNRPDQNTFHYK